LEVHIALDIYRGMVVRMVRGDPANIIIYSRDPVSKGAEILDSGVRRIHIVDLGAALEGRSIDRGVLRVAEELKRLGGFVTVAGGMKRLSDIEETLRAGADRVVVGSAVHKGLLAAEDVIRAGAGRVVLACDVRGGLISHSGWREVSGIGLGEALRVYSRAGFELFLVTSVEKDGTIGGLDTGVLSSIPSEYRSRVIYSGGVSSRRDLEMLAERGFKGAVVGRAYYEGLVSPLDISHFEVG